MAKTCGSKLEPFVDHIVTLLGRLMMEYNKEKSDDLDNELTEACLITIEAMSKSMPNEMGKHNQSIITAALELLVYDPNFIYDEDDESMEEEQNEDWGSDFDDED
jgi:hypothetical protein